MGKKVNKTTKEKISKDVVTNNDNTNVDNKEDVINNNEIYVDAKINKLSSLNIVELVSLERACSLLCKKYETTARLNNNSNSLFIEYNGYYEKIFNELKVRVLNLCKG